MSRLSRRAMVIGLAAAGLGPAFPRLAPSTAEAADAKRRVINLTIKNRRVVAPQGRIRVTQGEVVELRWQTDEQVELHLHGYDKKLTVKPGTQATMVLRAKIAGRFPLTSHGWGHHGTGHGRGHGHDALAFIEIYPR